MMDKEYISALKENPNIKDEYLKRIVIDSFRTVFYKLGEYGFLRWIYTQDIPDRLKRLVVDEFNAEDLIKHPNAVAYYSNNSMPDHDVIKVKDKNSQSILGDIIHEDMHFLQKGALGVFQLEGIAEYLRILTSTPVEKRHIDDSTSYSYGVNVDYVDFICQIMGDVL